MRDMLYEFFCPVDQENMWLEFLGRVRLIDTVQISADSIDLRALKLPGLSVSWFKKGINQDVELPQYRNKTHLIKSEIESGKYLVKVNFSSTEVRKKSEHMIDTVQFTIN